MAHQKGKAGAKKKFTSDMILELLPQPTTTAWQIAAKKKHRMSADTFGDIKRNCGSQWEKVGNQIELKPIKNQEKWGNGEIDFSQFPHAPAHPKTKTKANGHRILFRTDVPNIPPFPRHLKTYHLNTDISRSRDGRNAFR